jgi:hypothetical protein
LLCGGLDKFEHDCEAESGGHLDWRVAGGRPSGAYCLRVMRGEGLAALAEQA